MFALPRNAKDPLIHTVRITDPSVRTEVITACQKQKYLTYEEFLTIDQFGKHGYHTSHHAHGMTNATAHWAKAVPPLCKKKNVSHVVEFGAGDGQLAYKALTNAEASGQKLSWTCIEILSDLQEQTKKRFAQKKHLLPEVVSSIDDVSFTEPLLGIFSYSLDNLSPQLLTNTADKTSYPNAVIGLTLENDHLTETYIPEQILREKKISFMHGIYTDPSGLRFDFRSWKLHPGQCVYLPIQSLVLLTRFFQKMPVGSSLLIIDEFAPPQFLWQTRDLLVPQNLLQKKRRSCPDREKAYKTAGKKLYYYHNYGGVLAKLLHSLGCYLDELDIEQKLARTIQDKSWMHLRGRYSTYAILTHPKITRPIQQPLPIVFPRRTML